MLLRQVVYNFFSSIISRYGAKWVRENPGKISQVLKNYLKSNGFESTIVYRDKRLSLEVNGILILLPNSIERTVDFKYDKDKNSVISL